MLEKKSWEEFRETGLLLYINQILHVFGWAITYEYKNKKLVTVIPVRCKYRGFSGKCVSESYSKITKYLNKNIKKLLKESNE